MPGMVDKALVFLSKAKWIEQPSEDEIIVFASKRIFNIRSQLIKTHAIILAREDIKAEKKKLKKLAKDNLKRGSQRSLDEF